MMWSFLVCLVLLHKTREPKFPKQPRSETSPKKHQLANMLPEQNNDSFQTIKGKYVAEKSKTSLNFPPIENSDRAPIEPLRNLFTNQQPKTPRRISVLPKGSQANRVQAKSWKYRHLGHGVQKIKHFLQKILEKSRFGVQGIWGGHFYCKYY